MKPYHNKTGRKRGVIWGIIRAVAQRRKSFTWIDLVPPLTEKQAKENTISMAQIGALRRVERGRNGRAPKPAKFARV